MSLGNFTRKGIEDYLIEKKQDEILGKIQKAFEHEFKNAGINYQLYFEDEADLHK